MAALEREIQEINSQLKTSQAEIARQQADYDLAAANLAAAEAQAPDLQTVERELRTLQEHENQLRLEVGAAQQKVAVLEKTRRKALESQREELAQQVARYQQLERAFSKNGVPALLIEQALPQIETQANEILARLSGGTMSIRFVTQAAYAAQTCGKPWIFRSAIAQGHATMKCSLGEKRFGSILRSAWHCPKCWPNAPGRACKP